MLKMLPNGMHKLVNLRHLDIGGTQLEAMPGGVSKLIHLHFLSYFIVGKHEDNGIKELGALSNLYGSFEIRKLENVVDSCEAMRARITDKVHIDYLYLEWSLNDDMVLSSQTESDILGKLQPHNGLKKLTVKGYRGTIFPNWVGHSSYHSMTDMSLYSCNNCCMLPSLGQLPSLKSLLIENFNVLEKIGDEFYKNENDHSSSIAPFPSLVYLTFRGMPCWEVWHSSYSEAFPRLESLGIWDCPKLTGNLPNHLPTLERLYIYGCQQIVPSLPRVPAVRNLLIYESDKIGLEGLELSPETLYIRGCQLVVESVFKAMSISHLTCLKVIEISNSSFAISLSSDCLPKSLEALTIRNCRELELPKQQQQKYDLLELVMVNSCDSLTSFPLEDFPNLKYLRIERCENLESLSLSQPQHAALHRLDIDSCPSFVSFPGEGLVAPNLTSFAVDNCDKLKSLPCHMNALLPNLESLAIWGCPEIRAFPEGGPPPNLKELWVGGCEKQLSGLLSMGNLEALTRLIICGGGCESVKSFPQVGSLPQLPSLSTLELVEFPNLETLECNELLRLTSLQELQILGCPKLENMAGEKLPSSLLTLEIEGSSLLAERWEKKHPQLWPKISHIPSISVDFELVC